MRDDQIYLIKNKYTIVKQSLSVRDLRISSLRLRYKGQSL